MSSDSKSKSAAGLRGGIKRRRSGATMTSTGRKPPIAVPVEAAQSRGYRFPDDPATPSQLLALRRMFIDHLRHYVVQLFPDVSVELLTEFFGLGERQGKSVVARSRSLEGSALADLVLRVLHGMHTKEIAGVLGTPKTMDHRRFFRMIYEFDLGAFSKQLPSYVSEVNYLPLPSDARPGTGMTFQIKEANGSERSVQSYQARDGSLWMEDPSHPNNLDMLRVFHSAFRIEYKEWLKGD